MARTTTPEDDPIGVRLDRIIELLEQQRPTPYVFPYAPIYPRPYLLYAPYQGPYWWNTTGSGSVTSSGLPTTTYNITNNAAAE